MEPSNLKSANFHIKRAAAILRQGGIVAYPTEGVWGLGCDPDNAEAVLKLLRLKQRPWQKGLILIAADFAQVEAYVNPLDTKRMAAIHATWPGPVTWLLPARVTTPEWLRGKHKTLAVRVTAHPLAAALCRQFGEAIVSTSANLAGQRATLNHLQVMQRFGKVLDYILPGETGGQRRPSEIRDGVTGRVVRPV